MYSVILASKSPRRIELLKRIYNNFEVLPSEAEEVVSQLDPHLIVMELAEQKAENVFHRVKDYTKKLIIGSDTIVVLDNKVLGKPKNRENAYEMLSKLSANTHEVYTGVSLILGNEHSKKSVSFFEKSYVKFKLLTKEGIEEYINSGSPFDKAGGYGIQDSNFVEEIKGSYSCVMGFPVEKIKEQLELFLLNE